MKTLDPQVRLNLKNVLFCTDFSADTDVALPYAAELARHFGAKLFGLHVMLEDQYAFVPLEGGAIPPVVTDAQMRDKLKAMTCPPKISPAKT